MQSGEQRAPGSIYRMAASSDLDSIYASGRLPDVLRGTLEGAFSWQRRNETTLERTLNMPGLAPQWVAGLLAGGALAQVEGKSLPLAEVFQNAAKQEIEAVDVPVDGLHWGVAQVARTPVDEPIVFAIAAVRMAQGVVMQAKAVLTGVWQVSVGEAEAVNALAGGPLNLERIAEVSALVADEVSPKANYLGSVEYRRAMAVVLTRKALEMCLDGME